MQFTCRNRIFAKNFCTKSLVNKTCERQEDMWEGNIKLVLTRMVSGYMYGIGVTQESV